MKAFKCCVLIFLGILFAGCRESIVHDLSERDANTLTSRLHAAQIDAQKIQQADGRWSVAVDSSEMVAALSFLDSSRLLSARSGEPVSKSNRGLIPSREDQWFNYERSISSSIEATLLAVSGVLDARVHLNMPQSDPLLGARSQTPGTGSVLLVTDERFTNKDDEVAGLVSGASGVPAANVSILRSSAAKESVPHLPAAASGTVAEAALPIGASVRDEILMTGAAVLCLGIFSGLYLFRRRRRPQEPFPLRGTQASKVKGDEGVFVEL